MEVDAIIAIYGIVQIQMKDEGLINIHGAPIKSKHHSESDNDALSIYRWLAQQLKGVSEITINKRKEVFNDIVRGLEREYLLNMFLFGVFMLEDLIDNDGSRSQKIVLIPKINRLIKYFRSGILSDDTVDGFRIVRDSKIGASNVLRIFRGSYERTKAMRAYDANRWREAV